MDMVTSMMSFSSRSISFKGYAFENTKYILNLVPSKYVLLTLREMWKDRKPSLQHLHIWGCLVHVLEQKIDKLEVRFEVCQFVDYPKGAR